MAHSIAFAIVDDNSRDLQRLRHSIEAISGCTVMFAYTSPNQFFQQLVSTHPATRCDYYRLPDARNR